MGSLSFSTGFLVLSLFSLSSCMDSYFNLAPKLASKNHILVIEESRSQANGLFGGGKTKGDVANAMIVNGWEEKVSKFPFMISIQILEQRYKRYHICAGVLITTNKALTAAHCMDYWGGVEHFAAVGFNRLSQHGQAVIRIVDVDVHHRYREDREGYPHDIAIVTLEEHVTLSDTVQLANVTKPGDPDYDRYYCYIAGWGLTEDYYSYPDELRYATLLTITNRECKLFFKIFESKSLIRKHHICAWNWPYSACYGDSGGPLVCGDQVVGITSWSPDCTGCFPLVLGRMSVLWEWVEKFI